MEDRSAAGIWMPGGVLVERGFHCRDEPVAHRRVGARPPDWRHRLGPKPPHDLLPCVVCGRDVPRIEPLERQAADLALVVVTAEAVAIDQRTGIGGGSGRLLLGGTIGNHPR